MADDCPRRVLLAALEAVVHLAPDLDARTRAEVRGRVRRAACDPRCFVLCEGALSDAPDDRGGEAPDR